MDIRICGRDWFVLPIDCAAHSDCAGTACGNLRGRNAPCAQKEIRHAA
jgi:hypothetical protein